MELKVDSKNNESNMLIIYHQNIMSLMIHKLLSWIT